MAQPNVVREPSMDEILASIRKIIESNDPVPSTGFATQMAEPEGFSGSAANDDMEDMDDIPLTIDDTFAPRNEDRASFSADHPARGPESFFDAPTVRAEPAPVQPQKSLSLADVAARVRAASERNPGLRDLAPRAEEPQQAHAATSPLVTSRMAQSGNQFLAPETATPAPVAADPVAATPIPLAQSSTALATPPAASRFEPVQAEQAFATPAETPVHQHAAEPEMQPATDSVGPSESLDGTSLISAGAGQQVARSFQDLAVAIDQAERRSFDEIAEDLLRPMLQEWLDDNLPTLVERLVREEIERVARGGRR